MHYAKGGFSMSNSKPLSGTDESGTKFAIEMLDGDKTAGINFDRIQKHPDKGYVLFEYLLCEESQPRVTPWTSHPNKYWHLNSQKFISLYEIASKLEATLYLVNYAKSGTKHADEILVMEVHNYTRNGISTEDTKHSRDSFKNWFRQLNKECLKNN